jgi:hypothetical protein
MIFIYWPCLCRESVAEGVVAEEAHDADVAIETLSDVLGRLGANAQGLGHPRDRLWLVAQEPDEVSFLGGQLTHVSGLTISALSPAGSWSGTGLLSVITSYRKRCARGAESTDRGTICRCIRLPCDVKERSTNALQVGGRRQETFAELLANSEDTTVGDGELIKEKKRPQQGARGFMAPFVKAC